MHMSYVNSSDTLPFLDEVYLTMSRVMSVHTISLCNVTAGARLDQHTIQHLWRKPQLLYRKLAALCTVPVNTYGIKDTSTCGTVCSMIMCVGFATIERFGRYL